MSDARILVRHWRRKGASQLVARHPTRIRTAASAPASVAAGGCLAGCLLTLVAALVASQGWDPQQQTVTTAQRVLVPLLLVQLSVSGALFLAQRTLPRAGHTLMMGLWLAPLALTAVLAQGSGRVSERGALFLWGLYGLALALWMVARLGLGGLALTLCLSGPLLLLALWSAAGANPQATSAAALTVTIMAAAAIATVPGVLVARGVADLPRVHRWAGDVERWFAGRATAIFWLVGAKVGLLLAYLAFARWRFSGLSFVPGTAKQWGVAVACAVFLILPMRMARSRTLDVDRVRRVARTLGFIIGAAVAVPVGFAIGSVIVAQGHGWGATVAVGLLAVAVAASRNGRLNRKGWAVAALLPPAAVLGGYLVSDSAGAAATTAVITPTWLAVRLSVGMGLALIMAAWLAWREGELWLGVRVVGFVSLWIALVTLLRWTGTGLAGVDIVLTVMLLATAGWIRRHPRSRIAAIEVLALCGLPVIVIYGPDLTAGAPGSARPWLAAAALAAPGVAALWHHLGLTRAEMSVRHTAGLAGLAALYGMLACAVLILGSSSAQILSVVAEYALTFLAIPLSVLLIAMLEGRKPVQGGGRRGSQVRAG